MNKDTLSKANELNKKIEEYREYIDSIRGEIYAKEEWDKRELLSRANGCRCSKLVEKFFRLIFEGEKVVVQARYECSRRIEIQADEQLVQVVLNYLEEKKREFEKEFESLK